MKKLVITFVLSMIIGFSLQAQTGIGARGIFGVDGNAYGGLEFSIQKPGRYEFDLGVLNDSWKITGLKQRSFIDRTNFGVYFGYGLGIGYYDNFDELFGTFALN
ncbi:hypothetical protein ACFLT1_08875, partial [Bacteroidota bacterium]